MSGQLCLKWNNHANAFNKLLGKIYLEDMYSDGTILCQGNFYPVHRFVLSTCSEYFEKMFSQCSRLNNKHPFIIVKDIYPEQMEALLNYMYKGEVNVQQEMLPELIKAAEAFKIKGLAVPDEECFSKPSRKRSNASSPSSMPQKVRRHEEKQCSDTKSDDLLPQTANRSESENSNTGTAVKNLVEIYTDEATCQNIKTEPIDAQEPLSLTETCDEFRPTLKEEPFLKKVDCFTSDEDSDFQAFVLDPSNDNFDDGQTTSWDNTQAFEGEEGNEDDPHQRFADVASDTSNVQGNVIPCQFPGCSFKSSFPSTFKIHHRTHTGEKPFKCPQCPYRSSQKQHVRRHFRSLHANVKPYQCPICPNYKTTQKGTLKSHIFAKHASQYEEIIAGEGL